MITGAGLSIGGVAPATLEPTVGNPCSPRGGVFASFMWCFLSKLAGDKNPRPECLRRGLYQPSM